MTSSDRCGDCGAHRVDHLGQKAHTGCSKFRRRTEEEEASARETEAAFFAVVRASNEEKRRARYTMECDACDGCGWHEGGETLKTACQKCGGTGAK